MAMYALIRKILFQFEPESIHKIVLNSLKFVNRLGLLKYKRLLAPCTVMGIDFPNPVGLAGGFDRNCEYIDELMALGFGFIEVGTVTLAAQPGHPKPRLFRLAPAQALINRMGFYNKGIEQAIAQLKKVKSNGILGISIVKNFNTPLEEAIPDYLSCFRQLYPFAGYIAVNISSPNTPGLRNLQYSNYLNDLLAALKQEQNNLAKIHNKYVPLVIKISPDLDKAELNAVAGSLLTHHIDGVIAANTTLSREGVEKLPYANEQGGLSGKPLFAKSLKIVQQLHPLLNNKIPIIACGGIMNAEDARQMFAAGASLLQIYTGFIYQGPGIINEIISAVNKDV